MVMRRVVDLLTRWTIVVVAVLAWEASARAFDSLFFPPLTSIVRETYEVWIASMWTDGFTRSAVWVHLAPSLGRALIGLATATAIGVGVGLAIGRIRRVGALFEPVIHYLRGMPPVVIIPIFIILIGIGSGMRVAVIAFGCTWPILLNTIYGVRSVDPLQIDTARAFGIGRRRRITMIVLPAASPAIFAGLRISLSVALILMVVSEMVAGGLGGIGQAIMLAQRSFRIVEMWAGIVIVGMLGFVLNKLFERIEERVLAWHRAAAQGAT